MWTFPGENRESSEEIIYLQLRRGMKSVLCSREEDNSANEKKIKL
jgi:hypothetical protein